MIDHLLQIAGHPGRLSPGRFIAAGRRHGIAAGAQQHVRELVGHVIGKVVVGQPYPGRLFRGAPVGAQVAEDRAVAILDALDGCRDLRPELLPEGVERISQPAAKHFHTGDLGTTRRSRQLRPQGLSKVAQHCGRWADGMVEGMDSGSGAGMTRVTLSRQWNGPTQTRPTSQTVDRGAALV